MIKMTMEIVGQTINGRTSGNANIFTVEDNCTSTTTWTAEETDGTLTSTNNMLKVNLISDGSGVIEEGAYYNKNLKNTGAYIIHVAGSSTLGSSIGHLDYNGTFIARTYLYLTDGTGNETALTYVTTNSGTSAHDENKKGSGIGTITAHLTFKGGKCEGKIFSSSMAIQFQINQFFTFPTPTFTVVSIEEDVSTWDNVYLKALIYVNCDDNHASNWAQAYVPWIIKLDNYQTDIFDDMT